jgi:hypothetical protein
VAATKRLNVQGHGAVGFLLAVSFAAGLLFAVDILTLEQLTRYREQAMALSSLRTGGAQTLPHVCTGPCFLVCTHMCAAI